MASTRLVLSLLLSSLLLLSLSSLSLSKSTVEDLDEDLSFLEEDNDAVSHDNATGDDLGDDEFTGYEDFEQSDESSLPAVDEKDVLVLKEANFTDVIDTHKHVMVEFYAPWCGHCQSLAPEYAAAATQLKSDGVDVVLAKIDAMEESELSTKYDVQGFPTILFFVDGNHKPYNGERTKDGIISWIKKKTGPSIYNITTTEEAEKILTSEKKVVLAYLTSLTGTESEQLSASSNDDDDINFYQTTDPHVAKLFHIDPQAKRPVLILIKEEPEKLSYFTGQFGKFTISEFVSANKLPLVTTFTRESASTVFESQIKKQLLLFATADDSKKVLPIFEQAAKLYKGKVIFVYVQLDNEDIGKPVSAYFGIMGNEPKVLAYAGNEDGRKFLLEGEFTSDKIKAFLDDFLQDKLKPFYKSDPIPETNDSDVKIVVGNSFDEIVLDESKDVLLEVYAPWCGHCQSLEPIYNKLAKHLQSIDSIVIAKMDGTTNEHPRAKADAFPTILFFPAGNKSFDPVPVDSERTVVALYKFLKKHASIPFKLPKSSITSKVKDSDATNLKDEL